MELTKADAERLTRICRLTGETPVQALSRSLLDAEKAAIRWADLNRRARREEKPLQMRVSSRTLPVSEQGQTVVQ